MTIEGIARLRGSQLDLYSPQYFESSSVDDTPEDQLTEMIRGSGVILYGQEMVNWSPTAIALNGDYLVPHLDQLKFTYANREFTLSHKTDPDWVTDVTWRIDDPPIPPEVGYISKTMRVDMQKIRSRYLAPLDKTAPRYYSIDRSTDKITFVNDPTKPEDLLIRFDEPGFKPQACLFFVNGLCCRTYEEVFNGDYVTRVIEGRKYLRNLRDRDRGIVTLDFSKQCNIDKFPMNIVSGKLPRFTIDTTLDVDKYSFMLVFNGRLYLPDEFSVLNNHFLFFNKADYRIEYTLDQMCCANEFSDTFSMSNGNNMARNRTILGTDVALKEAVNSFLIAFDRPGLTVVRHDVREGDAQTFVEPKVDGSKHNRITFQGTANGLLFDAASRSVVDYIREENDMSFYDHTGTKPRIWRETTALVNKMTPLELVEKYNYVMKTCAVMHDRSVVQGNGFVLWPKYIMLDFLFRG